MLKSLNNIIYVLATIITVAVIIIPTKQEAL
jgi:hypothetical protein